MSSQLINREYNENFVRDQVAEANLLDRKILFKRKKEGFFFFQLKTTKYKNNKIN